MMREITQGMLDRYAYRAKQIMRAEVPSVFPYMGRREALKMLRDLMTPKYRMRDQHRAAARRK